MLLEIEAVRLPVREPDQASTRQPDEAHLLPGTCLAQLDEDDLDEDFDDDFDDEDFDDDFDDDFEEDFDDEDEDFDEDEDEDEDEDPGDV